MKTLYESLLDDFDTLSNKIDPREAVKQFIETYCGGWGYKISQKPNKDGKFEVSARRVVIRGKSLREDGAPGITNGMFVWTYIESDFICNSNPNITSLEGCPKIVGGKFDCSYCEKLTSLEGAPEQCQAFDCSDCPKLTSLKGGPKMITGDNTNSRRGSYLCMRCDNLESLEGAPQQSKMIPQFVVAQCPKLTSLKGISKKIDVLGVAGTGIKSVNDEVKKHCQKVKTIWE